MQYLHSDRIQEGVEENMWILDGVKGGYRKWVVRTIRMRWVSHVALMEERRKYRILVGNLGTWASME